MWKYWTLSLYVLSVNLFSHVSISERFTSLYKDDLCVFSCWYPLLAYLPLKDPQGRHHIFLRIWKAARIQHYFFMQRGKRKKTKVCLSIRIPKVTVKAPTVEYWNLFENIMLDGTLWQDQQEDTLEPLAPLCLKGNGTLCFRYVNAGALYTSSALEKLKWRKGFSFSASQP